jgi:hypothetical protein
MKKQNYLIVLFVIFLGLSFSIYQYFQAFKTENVSAVTINTPNPGHTWSSMECSGDSLCIDPTGSKLGIGTNTPSEKLTVNGNLSITGSMTGGTVPWSRLGSFPSACPAGQYVTTIGGTLTCSTPTPTSPFVTASASDTVRFSSMAEVGTSSYADVLLATLGTIPANHNKNGVYRITYDYKYVAGANTRVITVKADGVGVQSVQLGGNTSYQTFTYDFTIPHPASTTITVWGFASGGAIYLRNITLSCTETPATPTW